LLTTESREAELHATPPAGQLAVRDQITMVLDAVDAKYYIKKSLLEL
jgi:hypothetical protein